MRTALIVGDSQAQGAGAKLQARLAADGYKVTRTAKHGADSAAVAELASKHKDQKFDLVVVFSGSTAGGAPAAKLIPAWFKGSKVYWYGPSPATTILDLGLARAVFGAKVDGPAYWSTSGEAAARESRNVELPRLLPAGVQYVDWRRLRWSGGYYPAQPDGIHVGAATAAEAFSAVNWPPPAHPTLQAALVPALLLLVVWWIAKDW